MPRTPDAYGTATTHCPACESSLDRGRVTAGHYHYEKESGPGGDRREKGIGGRAQLPAENGPSLTAEEAKNGWGGVTVGSGGMLQLRPSRSPAAPFPTCPARVPVPPCSPTRRRCGQAGPSLLPPLWSRAAWNRLQEPPGCPPTPGVSLSPKAARSQFSQGAAQASATL